jgi:gluconate kinase
VQRARKQPGIITCSALKRSYRQIIIGARPEVRLVYLRGGIGLRLAQCFFGALLVIDVG